MVDLPHRDALLIIVVELPLESLCGVKVRVRVRVRV